MSEEGPICGRFFFLKNIIIICFYFFISIDFLEISSFLFHVVYRGLKNCSEYWVILHGGSGSSSDVSFTKFFVSSSIFGVSELSYDRLELVYCMCQLCELSDCSISTCETISKHIVISGQSLSEFLSIHRGYAGYSGSFIDVLLLFGCLISYAVVSSDDLSIVMEVTDLNECPMVFSERCKIIKCFEQFLVDDLFAGDVLWDGFFSLVLLCAGEIYIVEMTASDYCFDFSDS